MEKNTELRWNLALNPVAYNWNVNWNTDDLCGCPLCKSGLESETRSLRPMVILKKKKRRFTVEESPYEDGYERKSGSQLRFVEYHDRTNEVMKEGKL